MLSPKGQIKWQKNSTGREKPAALVQNRRVTLNRQGKDVKTRELETRKNFSF